MPDISKARKLAAGQLRDRASRASNAIWVAGAFLDTSSDVWSDKDRENGVWVRWVQPTPTEEEMAITEAVKAGASATSPIALVKLCLYALQTAQEPLQAEEEEDGNVKVTLAPPTDDWIVVNVNDTATLWTELGPQGRAIVVEAFQRSTSVSGLEVAPSRASFRSIASR